jgi:hypothetical protein
MKKIMALALILTLVSIAATAQNNPRERFRHYRMEQRWGDGQLNRPERLKLRQDMLRYRIAHKRAMRDGRIGPMERRKLMLMRQHNRRELFYFRHNKPRRVI